MSEPRYGLRIFMPPITSDNPTSVAIRDLFEALPKDEFVISYVATPADRVGDEVQPDYIVGG